MMQFRFWIATAALCLAAQSAAAEGTSGADCRAVWENGSNRRQHGQITSAATTIG
jgi:hypothetical protein